MVMDIQTYATYEGMLHKETKLKELIEKLQVGVLPLFF